MESVRVYSWKPSNATNFGDEIGPMVVQELCKRANLELTVLSTTSPTHSKLLAIGSVLHEARGSDVVWGVGVNSKHRSQLPRNSNIEFRAVRGPLTRSFVQDQGFKCPDVYGDPGLLFPMLFDHEIRTRRGELERGLSTLGAKMPETIVIPNINDDRFLPYFAMQEADDSVMIIRPNLAPITVAAYISSAKRVICSSLHGLVFADVYGRETTRLISQFEPEFKYTDYFEGTGRDTPIGYANVNNCLDSETIPSLNWDPEPLLRSFPFLDEQLVDRLKVRTFGVKPEKMYEIGTLINRESPLGQGWSEPHNNSAWTTKEWVDFEFILKESILSNAIMRMRVGTLEKGVGAFVVLRTIHKGKMIASHRIVRGEPSMLIEIPLPETESANEISLQFKIENASKPCDYGLGDDSRSLGVWISEFVVNV